MTYQELAWAIELMTPEQRAKPVMIHLIEEERTIQTEDSSVGLVKDAPHQVWNAIEDNEQPLLFIPEQEE